MNDITAPFKEKGAIAIPLLINLSSSSGSCGLRISALQKDFVLGELPPRYRSTIMMGFGVWRATKARLDNSDGENEDGDEEVDRRMVAMEQATAREMDAIDEYVASGEAECRAAWPYETFLCDQVIGSDEDRAMFACYPFMADFPNLSFDSELGICRVSASVPSMFLRVAHGDIEPQMIPDYLARQIVSNSGQPPMMSSIPGGRQNTSFEHEYLRFPSRP